ncbi:MAG: alpha-2-macroglobulin family protein [Elusimicrobia bacterium]|nr:alpha-2-macroglobulin family protein [Elusimicrobiota bacterium]
MSEQPIDAPESRLGKLVRWCFKKLAPAMGEVSWTPPEWLKRLQSAPAGPGWRERLHHAAAGLNRAGASLAAWVREQAGKDPKFRVKVSAAGAAAVLLPIGILWYQHQPKVVRFSVTGNAPGPTRMSDNPAPDPVHVDFGGSAARLDKMGKPVARGITLSPSVHGIWRWETDRRLTFTPKEDWAIGQEYVVKLDKSLFPDHVKLETYEYKFKSAPFMMSLNSAEFYQDPTDPKLKKVVATAAFSHPVDPAEFEKRVFLRLAGQEGGFLGLGAKSFPFTVLYNRFKTEAYVHSDAVEIPMKDTYMLVAVQDGVPPSRPGPASRERAERTVPIPGMYNFFRVESVELAVVRNERFEPERVLVVRTSAGALESEIQKALRVVELPKDLPAVEGRAAIPNFAWRDSSRVPPDILAAAKPVALAPIPTDREYSAAHSFKFTGTPDRFLYIKVAKGIQSYGGYILAKDLVQTAQVPAFEKELKIMSEGAILSLSGEKKVSVISRDVDAIRFEAARVVPNQINHLVTQSQGMFRDPQFRYNFGLDNIAERLSEVRQLHAEPGKSVYSSFDLSDYLSVGDGTKRGLFFFKAEAVDPVTKQPIGLQDKRLVLVTDLGILVKEVLGGGREVFVQSIGDGSPVSGAQVQVLGKNGVPVLSAATDGEGRASFPSLSGFEREKAPTVFVARKGADLAFLPYDWEDRRLNFSRFDIGGARTPGLGEPLQAYLFSDRGIYRPGDELRVGLIVKPSDWRQNIAGVPLEAAITDARGLEVFRSKIMLSPLGFEEFRFTTEETAPTGAWQAGIYVVKDGRRGALLGSTSLRIEEFLPDRLHITTRLSKERADGWVSPKDLKATVFLKNLFGTPASGRKVRAEMSLSPAFPAFRAFPDHVFFDPQAAKNSFTDRLEDRESSDSGEAEFDLDLTRFEKATYRLLFTAEGFETGGGRGVVAQSQVLVSPREFLLGYKPDGELRYVSKGSARSVEIIAVDQALKKTAAGSLKAHVVELRYVSVLVRQENATYKYESVLKEVPVHQAALSVPAGGLRFPLPTAEPGSFALVVRDSQDTELCRVLFSVAGQANITRSLEKNAELKIQLSRADYAPGDEIELQVNAPYSGAGLITIEREKVYAAKWFRSGTTASTHRIRIPAEVEGNAYVVVSFVRSMDSPEIYMSPLSYGVAPFSVSRERRTDHVTLDCPSLARSGQPFRIRYSADKPGRIVVFAVDEGILQVAGYKTPDPLARFFEKRSLEVTTSQILDLILPEFKLVQSLSAPGGDMGREALGKNLNPFKRRRDKPVAYWSGIMDVDQSPREAVYEVPSQFNGTLRVMAVVVAPDSIGVAEKKSVVRGHFVLTPSAPVAVAPGDEFEVSLGVANQAEGSGPDAELSVELKTSEHLEVVGSPSQKIKVGENREAGIVFKLRAKDKLGSGSMTFTAVLGDRKSQVSVDASVRPPQAYVTTLAGGVTKSATADIPVTRRMYPHFRILEAGVSPLPMVLVSGLVRYLEAYPYGCTEQVVSQAFPALVLRGRKDFGYSAEKTKLNLDRAIAVLRGRQNAEGSFGLWSAESEVSDLQTAYALHFLTEAKERGFPVPSEVLAKGLAYLGSLVGTEPSSLGEARARAYAAYILTRNGAVLSAPLAALRRHLDVKFPKGWRKDLTSAYLAGVYKMLKQEDQASSLIGQTRIGDPGPKEVGWFYDGLVHDSQYLYILARHFPEKIKEVKPEALDLMVQPVVKGTFNSLSGAYAILALTQYGEAMGPSAAVDAGIAELDAQGVPKKLGLSGGLYLKAGFSDKAKTVRFINLSGRKLYYQATMAGFDLDLPAKEVKNKLEVQREFRHAGGGVTAKAGQGDELEVRLKMRAMEGAGSLSNVAIVDLLPGGFEVVMDRKVAGGFAAPQQPQPQRKMARRRAVAEGEGEGDGGGEGEGSEGGEGYSEGDGSSEDEGSGESAESPAPEAGPSGFGEPSSTWRPQYADVREDRVVLFGSVTTQAQEFVYKIRATNKGVFTAPPVFAEGMYDRGVQARGLPGKMTVE